MLALLMTDMHCVSSTPFSARWHMPQLSADWNVELFQVILVAFGRKMGMGF